MCSPCSSCYFAFLLISVVAFSHGDMLDKRVLNVGEELKKEYLPLKMGSCLYELHGLKSNTWYEVKISYPASIPASFSLQLKRGNSDLELKFGRKLLNTEKLIFRTDKLNLLSDQGGIYVLVSVEPEGVVAIPQAEEREHVIYNIVCDELYLGIPREAWYVVVLVLLCLGFAFLLPSFLPPYLLPKNQGSQIDSKDVSKVS